ncbi:hypothetical protein PC9H_000026 [Pleurotus ostreatus]|uniref:DUF5648 domain-containing protein n=2 Tax=Pleurotus ostreatus TaxID=5322 RepID=A0A067NWP3_PLEO1|nr:uncharacterized protein PC9H_000026 [Pleurotus ostreatus]KAF7439690.1 hypothetical protein PC9H_000026 [Pleurotus ostreatus]KAJ8701151.1 hypothetical protein PTI98_004108 [Pleurotus ostreatus]KDQ32488.1 hypothetical protein PLEOSDRAFT_1073059 [Pleurotus ostreatus PC15]
MKFSLAVVASLFAAAQAASIPPVNETLTNTDPCPRPHTEVYFFRAFNPSRVDHFYTTSVQELTSATHVSGYASEGIQGFIFPSPEASTVPLYRLFHPARTDHFYTTNEAEAISATGLGWNRQGIAGYVLDRPICGSAPLFRLYNAGNVDHFYTTSAAERDNFLRSRLYVDEGIAAFIYV